MTNDQNPKQPRGPGAGPSAPAAPNGAPNDHEARPDPDVRPLRARLGGAPRAGSAPPMRPADLPRRADLPQLSDLPPLHEPPHLNEPPTLNPAPQPGEPSAFALRPDMLPARQSGQHVDPRHPAATPAPTTMTATVPQSAHRPANEHRSASATAPAPPKRSARRKARRSPVIRILGYAGLGLLCLVLAGATFVFIADPAQIIRDQMISRVKAATGRDLIIAGGTHFTFFPSIGVSMSKVSLSAPPRMGGKPTLTMARLNAALKLAPLLKRKIVVERLILTKPVINLRVNRRGHKSWDFAASHLRPQAPDQAPGQPPRIRYAQIKKQGQINDASPARPLPPALKDFANGTTDAPAARSPLAMLEGLSLNNVRIAQGTLRYIDQRNGTRHNVDAINLKVSLRDIASPLSTSGDLVWSGEKINLSATVKSLRDLAEERPTNLVTKVATRHVKAGYNGKITIGAIVDLSGKLNATSPSVRNLSRWLGTTLPPSAGFGPLKMNGWLNLRGDQIDLIRLKVSLDGATANGDVRLKTGGRKPQINARLNLSVLDLNKYLPRDGAQGNKPRNKGAGKGKARRVSPSRAKNINELLGKNAQGRPQVRGFTKRAGSGWSTAPIDASALNLANANINFNVGRILVKDIKIGDTRLKATLQNGKLIANLLDMQLYKGRGNARVVVKSKRRGINMNASVKLINISALPLLRDAAKFERIDGRGNLALLVSSEGRTQKAIISALLGNGRFSFADGALVGVNIPRMIRGLQSGQVGNLNGGKSLRTDFSALTGSFQITSGIARNRDLKLISPLLRMNGAGLVSLPHRTIDYTVKPKIVASLAGQGSSSVLNGLEIPVRITGPWAKPKVGADFAAMTRNPQNAIKTIQQIGKKLRGKNAKKALNDLLGGRGGKTKAKDLLNQLFR